LSGDIRQSNLKRRLYIVIKDRGESRNMVERWKGRFQGIHYNHVKEERMDIIEDERLDQ